MQNFSNACFLFSDKVSFKKREKKGRKKKIKKEDEKEENMFLGSRKGKNHVAASARRSWLYDRQLQ